MTLVAATLADAFEDIFDARLDDPADVADALADAYADYAAAGMFGASTVTIVPAKTAALAATIFGAIASPAAGSAANFASAWSSGLIAFWPGVLVVGAQSGTVTACPGAVSLVATLSAIFADTGNTVRDAAEGLANELHTATLTAVATVAPPPGTVLPIT